MDSTSALFTKTHDVLEQSHSPSSEAGFEEATLETRPFDVCVLVGVFVLIVMLGGLALGTRFSLASERDHVARARARETTSAALDVLVREAARLQALVTQPADMMRLSPTHAAFVVVAGQDERLVWAPRVGHADLDSFATTAVADVGARLFNLSSANVTSDGVRGEYFPVLYETPPVLENFLVDLNSGPYAPVIASAVASNVTEALSVDGTTRLARVVRHSTTGALLGVIALSVSWDVVVSNVLAAHSVRMLIADATAGQSCELQRVLYADAAMSCAGSALQSTASSMTAQLGTAQLRFSTAPSNAGSDNSTSLGLLLASAIVACLLWVLAVIAATRGHALTEHLTFAVQAEQTERNEVKQFMGFLTHELRNPLYAVMGTAGELREVLLKRKAHRLVIAVNSIDVACDRMSSIINDVLSMRKLEEGKLELDLSVFSPSSLVGEIERMFKSRARERGILLDVDVGDDVQAAVVGDSSRIIQILSNLVSNALKFTPRQGTVTIGLSSKTADDVCMLRFFVRDTGVGMAPESLERIFEPYTQATAKIESQHGGTGLGLSIVRMLCECMGGTVHVRSQLNVGTIFHVDLPLKSASKMSVAVPSTDSDGGGEATLAAGLDSSTHRVATALPGQLPAEQDDEDRGSGSDPSVASEAWQAVLSSHDEQQLRDVLLPVATHATVLVVDDVEINQRLVQRVLRQGFPNMRVDTACNGAEAVDLVRQTEYDMVFMDVHMPVLNGRQAATQMRAAGFTKPIIAVTGADDRSALQRNLQAGYSSSVLKPLRRSTVLALARRYLQLSSLPSSPRQRTSPRISPSISPAGSPAPRRARSSRTTDSVRVPMPVRSKSRTSIKLDDLHESDEADAESAQ